MPEKNVVFDFDDYKAYLKYLRDHSALGGRGFQAKLANISGCQTAYVSQILNGNAHFSLEQAYAVNKLLMHTKAEARFFILLIQSSRAGNAELRNHFREIMEEELNKHLNLRERFQVKNVLSYEDKMTYYSEWYYAAVHILMTIPSAGTPEKMAEYLNLPLTKVRGIIKFLISSGLAKEERGKYVSGNNRIHIGKDSSLLSKHHINWRMKAIQSFDQGDENSLNYTSIVSLSKQDLLKLKSKWVREIESFNSIVRDSKEETLACLNLDFFKLI